MNKLFTRVLIFIGLLVTCTVQANTPAIVSVDPGAVEQGKLLEFTVTGENTDFSQGTNFIKFVQGSNATIEVRKVVYSSMPEQLDFSFAFTRNTPLGNYDLSIYNTTSGQTLIKNDAVILNESSTPVSIESIMPTSSKQGEQVSMTIKCKNTSFANEDIIRTVYLYNSTKRIYYSSIDFVDSVTIVANFNLDYTHVIGNYNMAVENEIDGKIFLENAFELKVGDNVPTIVSVEPGEVEQGKLLDFTVTGENTNFTQGTNVVQFSQGSNVVITVNEYLNSDDSLKMEFSHIFNQDMPSGYYDLSVLNWTGYATVVKSNAVFVKEDVTPPSIVNSAPTSAVQGNQVSITIKGQNTNFGSLGSDVYLSNSSNRIYSIQRDFVDSTTIVSTFELKYSHAVGKYDLVVYNRLDGTLILKDAFELNEGVDSPKILSVEPGVVHAGDFLEYTVTGENFDFSQGTNVISFRQGTSFSIDVNSSVYSHGGEKLNFSFAFPEDYPSGRYDLAIFNTESSTEIVKEYAVLVTQDSIANTEASIVSVTPGELQQGKLLDFTVTGANTNFTQGTHVISFKQGSNVSLSVEGYGNVVNDSVLTFNYAFPSDQPSGYYDLCIFDLVSKYSLIKEYAFWVRKDSLVSTQASIVSVTPEELQQGKLLDFTVTGENTNFSQGTHVISFKQGSNVSLSVEGYGHVVNDSVLTFNYAFPTDQPSGYYDLCIFDLVSKDSLMKEYAFLVRNDSIVSPQASIVSVTPEELQQGKLLDFTVTGENTNFTQGTHVISFKQGSNVSLSVEGYGHIVNDSVLTFNYAFPTDQPNGYYDLCIFDLVSKDSLIQENAVEVLEKEIILPASILSVEPGVAYQAEELEITVTGENVYFSGGTNIITFRQGTSNIASSSIYAFSSNPDVLTFKYIFDADMPVGTYDIEISNGTFGGLRKDSVLTLRPDRVGSIANVTPDKALQGRPVKLAITGVDTNFGVGSYLTSVALTNGGDNIYPDYVNVIDNLTLEAQFYLSSEQMAGFYDLEVSNSLDGEIIIANAFEVIEDLEAKKITTISSEEEVMNGIVELIVDVENVDLTQGENTVTLVYQGSVKVAFEVIVIDSNTLKARFNFGDEYLLKAFSDLPEGMYSLMISNSSFDPENEENQTIVIPNVIYMRNDVITEVVDNESRKLGFYPNPATNVVNLTAACDFVQIVTLEGIVVAEAISSSSINVSDLSSGLYLIKMIKDDEKVIEKIIIE